VGRQAFRKGEIEAQRNFWRKTGLRLTTAEKWAFLERLIRQKRFSDFSRIRDYAAKCGDLEAEKFQNWREKDSVAVDRVQSERFSAQFPC
jgi:hypothetical protein